MAKSVYALYAPIDDIAERLRKAADIFHQGIEVHRPNDGVCALGKDSEIVAASSKETINGDSVKDAGVDRLSGNGTHLDDAVAYGPCVIPRIGQAGHF